MAKTNSRIIGIDLGTTNSCVAIQEGDTVRVIENPEGNRTTPSVVAYASHGETLVGVSAHRQAITNPLGTFSATKRLIGRRFEEPEVTKSAQSASYKIIKNDNGDAWLQNADVKISPPEISALILRKMKEAAEAYLGETVSRAVITVPAYFNDAQRQSTKDAGRIAGLEVERIINEPTAAALAFGQSNADMKEGKIAVYDLGGGTFDVSIIEMSQLEGESQYEVLATSGDTFLGGEDFNARLITYLIDIFKKESGINVASDMLALQRLKEAAERAKIELSTTMETDINLPYLTADAAGPKHFVHKLNRAKLESMVEDLIEKTFISCRDALTQAKLEAKDISEIVLVGGQTRMPLVQKRVEDFFGKAPRKDVNPDEAVAVGAAIQGAVLGGQRNDILLLDVTPLTLGIETMGGLMTPLIARNTTVPTRSQQLFTTAEDNQPAVTVKVLQGERAMAIDNKVLGEFNLEGIAAQRRGAPQIEVSFDIDANGILNVSAKEKSTGKESSVKITTSSGLEKSEIDRMVKEAEQKSKEDLEKRKLQEKRNEAEAKIYDIAKEKSMSEEERQTWINQVKGCDTEIKLEKIIEEMKKSFN